MNAADVVIGTSAALYPTKRALEGARPISYGELAGLVARAGNTLRALGCDRRSAVLTMLPDSPEFVAAFLGAARIGAMVVPVSPLSQAPHITRYLAETSPTVAIVHATAQPAFADAVHAWGGRGGMHTIVVGASSPDGTADMWDDVLAGASEELNSADLDPDHPMTCLYTSGSTARQKPVVHPHRSFPAAVRNVGFEVFGVTPRDVVLSVPRMTFAFGLGFGMCFPLAAGGSIVVHQVAPDLPTFVDSVNRYRPTVIVAVPSYLTALDRVAGRWLDVDLSSVRLVASAGEPLPRNLALAFQARFGVEIVDGIGSTELLTHFISNRPGQIAVDSCGTPVPSCAVRLLDEDGRDTADGAIGTAWVCSDTAFSGYLGDATRTAATIVDGWVRTGDRMRRDAAGSYHYCGRDDDAIKISGVWVSTVDVQAALCACANVERAVVIPCGDPTGLRRLVAYVVPAADSRVSGPELLDWLASQLPEYMLPAAFVFLDSLPLTPNGKVARGQLPPPRWVGRSDDSGRARCS